MPLEVQDPGASLGLPRGSQLVFVPVAGNIELAKACIQSVIATVPSSTPLLVIEDGPEGRSLADFFDALDPLHPVHYWRNPERRGFTETANQAFAAAGAADVVILNSDCLVAGDWLSRVTGAAAADARVATVSTLTNHGSILSVPVRNHAQPNLPPGWTVDSAADAIARRSLGLRPEIPVAVGHCMLVTRRALDLVGGFDEAFSPGYGEEVDFSQRCVRKGLSHVLADDVFVEHRGGGSFGDGDEVAALKLAHKKVIDDRYPHHEPVIDHVRAEDAGSLARALGVASRTLNGLTVTIDGRCLGGDAVTGTAVHALGVIDAVSGAGIDGMRVLVPDDLGEEAASRLSALPGVTQVTVAQAWEGVGRTSVIHRPFQVMSEYDLELLPRLAERIVVTQQDMIAWSNPFYFETAEEWLAYRRLTRHTLSLADLVLFFSEHAKHQALAAEVVDEDRAHVVPIGTDHAGNVAPKKPARFPDDDRPFLVCLGTDFHHKNRPFAMALRAELARAHGWDGRLVLAGASVRTGSSRADEASWGMGSEAVTDLGEVTEAEKAWLLENASAVVYPSTYEGFGLIPFEAARAGTPCLFAPQTSLAEYLPAALATLEPWNAEESAGRVAALLSDDEAARAHVEATLRVAAGLTWEKSGPALVAAYERVAATPLRRERGLAQEATALQIRSEVLEKQAEMLEVQKREQRELIEELQGVLDNEARALVGPDALLPAEMKRPLIAISRKPALRRLLFGPLVAAHRALTGIRGPRP